MQKEKQSWELQAYTYTVFVAPLHSEAHCVKVTRSNTDKHGYSSSLTEVATPLLELTCHMGSHSVTCGRGDIPAFTPAELAGTRFSDLGGMQG